MEKIIIIGAGGHGKVLADAISKSKNQELIGFIDAKLPKGTHVYKDFKVIENQDNILKVADNTTKFIIGIGNNQIRRKIYDELTGKLLWATIIHPSAAIADDVIIGEGSVLLANSVVNASSIIGQFTIVDSGVVVDHESKIGEFTHLSIGTLVGSNCEVESNYKSMIGQVIEPFSKI